MYEFTVTCALLKRYAKGSGWGLKKKVLALRAPVWSKKGVGGGGCPLPGSATANLYITKSSVNEIY